ncbi:MAG: transcription termination/antitermination factor NusG [Ruminococcaceae bacterium]|nr:transcription termination/antitermination factor NusG [Oscillospiraceae bacterium]
MNAGPRWYVAHTYSGYENKVKMNLEKIVENRGLGHLIFDVRIPIETIVESDGGVEREIESKIFPSYVLVKMIMTDESWHVVRNIRGVTGFVGPGSKPVPLTDEEAAAIIEEDLSVSTAKTAQIGDTVDIVEGIFAGYSGRLSEISADGTEVTVVVSTVGRDMPINLDVKHIRKTEH